MQLVARAEIICEQELNEPTVEAFEFARLLCRQGYLEGP